MQDKGKNLDKFLVVTQEDALVVIATSLYLELCKKVRSFLFASFKFLTSWIFVFTFKFEKLSKSIFFRILEIYVGLYF